MNRREFIVLIGGLSIAWSLACYSQQSQTASLKRIGILNQVACPITQDWIMHRRLAELGWVEGRNFVFDCVSIVGRLDQLPALARELVSRQPDVLVAALAIFVRALKQETTTIPIVMLSTFDPVRTGLVTNLARPDGNVTGVTWFGPELFPKRIQILKETVPQLRQLAIIRGANLRSPEMLETGNELLRTTASKLGFDWQRFEAVVASDYDEIFARIEAEHFDAVAVAGDALAHQNATRLCQLALRHKIPAVGDSAEWAKCGLLLGYGQDYPWTEARASEYIDKILRGTKPGDLPVEQAPKFRFAINLKTAKALGLTVPSSLFTLADEVIE
jgi:putative ABC transport system substrate-binding protein